METDDKQKNDKQEEEEKNYKNDESLIMRRNTNIQCANCLDLGQNVLLLSYKPIQLL